MFISPRETYKITGPITVNASDITIYGDNRLTSAIQQATANTVIFQWTNETTSGAFGIVMHDLGLNFTNIPTTSSTGQWGIEFTCSTNLSYGYALSSFERLSISNSYVGIGSPSSGNPCGVWSTTFRSILFTYTQYSAISFTSGGVGLPSNVLDKINVLNYKEGSTALQSSGPAIQMYGTSCLVLHAINIEGWYNLAYDLEGGRGTLIDQPRFERLHLTSGGSSGGYSVLFFLGNSDFTVRNLVIESFAETTQSGVASIFSVGNGSSSGVTNLDLSGAYLPAATLGTGAAINMFKAPNAQYARINDRGLVLGAGISEYSSTSDQYSRVTVDGLPPFVTSLPTASSAYRGRMFTVLSSGSGVADVTYLCLETSTGGTYAWHSI